MKFSRNLIAATLLAACSLSSAFAPSTRSHASLNRRPVASNNIAAAPSWSVKQDAPTSLLMASDVESEAPSFSFNPLFGALWIGFNAFAFLGPGTLGDPADTAIIMSYIDNPADPGFSEAFQLIFNYLGIMPMIVAALAVPQAAQRGLPPLPFLAAGFGLGFGGIGPYLSFRAPPRDEFIPSEASWFTKNVLESKIFGWGLVAGILFVPFFVGLVDSVTTDAAAVYQSYADLFATSKFVSTSSVDAAVLNVAAAALIPRDLKLRQPEIEESKANLIGASTLLFPFLGAALYCALRPALPKED